MTFRNMNQKLWPNMLLFIVNEQSVQIRFLFIFHKQKFEIDFSKVYICGILCIVPFSLMSQKL